MPKKFYGQELTLSKGDTIYVPPFPTRAEMVDGLSIVVYRMSSMKNANLSIFQKTLFIKFMKKRGALVKPTTSREFIDPFGVECGLEYLLPRNNLGIPGAVNLGESMAPFWRSRVMSGERGTCFFWYSLGYVVSHPLRFFFLL